MLSQETGSKYRLNLWQRYVNSKLIFNISPFPPSNAGEEKQKRRNAMQLLLEYHTRKKERKQKQIKTRNISKIHPHNSNSASGVENLSAHFSPSENL